MSFEGFITKKLQKAWSSSLVSITVPILAAAALALSTLADAGALVFSALASNSSWYLLVGIRVRFDGWSPTVLMSGDPVRFANTSPACLYGSVEVSRGDCTAPTRGNIDPCGLDGNLIAHG